jgi:hypothetical protein
MRDQREGIDLPAVADVAHDGVLCTFSNRSEPDRGKWCGSSGQATRTVHHVQNYFFLSGFQQNTVTINSYLQCSNIL